ncbi:MAG: IS200/IS605 family transposase [Melioribacteraceae bacterium]|nr:IS200/IS605 family transposase [Melioribacteraceae bacterium]
MANTYTQIYIHAIFTVQGRLSLIPAKHKVELHKYISGIITKKGSKLIQINSMPDHVHLLIGLNPQKSLSELVKEIKANSSKHINENKWVVGKFAWQKGYGAFSYSHSQLQIIINYILNQEVHHARKSFQEEYLEFLDKYKIQYDRKYIFDFYNANEG